MDLLEVTQNVNRHPWELSRADCIFNLISDKKFRNIADVGAGDGYFTNKLKTIAQENIFAIDTGYSENEKDLLMSNKIKRLSSVEELPNNLLNMQR